MKLRTPISTVLLGALLVLPMIATGEGASVTNTREVGSGKSAGRMTAPPMMATGTKTMPPRMEEARERMMEKRGEILKHFAEKMIKRMNAAIDRLTKLADRLQSRITKEKARGVDTSITEANLGIARTKLSDARAAVVVAENAVAEAVAAADTTDSTKPMDAGKPVREALGKARDAVFAAHKALVAAISSLTGKRVKESATTTPGTTPTP